MIAAPVTSQPTGPNDGERILVATKVAVREVKTSRYQIFGFVYSKYVRS
jgi:hypothetical protein